jgi:hypothetical protein
MDLEMLAISSNGKERTEREFADLFAKVGLALVVRRAAFLAAAPRRRLKRSTGRRS